MATYAHLYSPYEKHPRRGYSLGKAFAWVHIESPSIWLFLATNLILFLLGAILGTFAPSRNTHESTVKLNDLGSTPIPEHVFLPRIPTVMTPNDQYIGWNSASNKNWMLLLHGPGESVWIPNASEYGLGEGFSSPFRSKNGSDQTKSFYHISSLHQLHCLNIVRMATYHRVQDLTSLSEVEKEEAKYHIEHCIEYLRQSIMCGDVLVVEPNSPPGSPRSEVEDDWGNPLGWGITKQCINWQNLKNWQRKQHDAFKRD